MRLSVGIAVALVFLALVSAGNASASCRAVQWFSDPNPDTTVPSTLPGVDVRPAEILNTSIERMPNGLLVTVQLAGDPRGQTGVEFSYWAGFLDGGKSLGGNPPTWTFQNSASYANIDTMYWNTTSSYPVTWNQSAFSFTIPWSDFAKFYGAAWPIEFGSPFAESSGPYVAGSGINNPSQDSDSFSNTLVPLPSCPPPASSDGAPSVPPSIPAATQSASSTSTASSSHPPRASPSLGIPATMLGLSALVVGVRRTQ